MTKLTEADQRLIHAYVTEGGCWHTFRGPYNHPELYICDHCKKSYAEVGSNPDYSTRQHFPDLTGKLFGDEMWNKFYHSTYTQQKFVMEWASNYTRWLFSDYTRFVALFAEFLRLESTVMEFGKIDCHHKKEWPRTAKDGGSTFFCELECNKQDIQSCNGTGKILKPWAKLVEEGK